MVQLYHLTATGRLVNIAAGQLPPFANGEAERDQVSDDDILPA